MRISHPQRLLFVLALLAAVLIGANAALAFHAEEVLADSEHWVTHTLEVITDLERALRTAYDAESSARGFVLTGDPAYLGGYQYAQNTLAGQFEALVELTRDNPEEHSRMMQAGDFAAEKLRRLATGIELRKVEQQHGDSAEQNRRSGRELMSKLNDTVQVSEQAERRLLTQRLKDSARARFEAKLTIVLASGFDLLFVFGALWALAYERRLRQREAATASRLQKLQSVTEVAFTQLTATELTVELLRRLRGTAETDVLAMFRWLGTEVELVAAEGVPVKPDGRRLVRAEGVLAEVARTGEAVRLTGPELNRLPVETLGAELQSALVLPMTVGGRVIAMLLAGRREDTRFSAGDEELLVLAADRIALALDRAAAYDAEREARQIAEQSAAEVKQLNEVLEERVQQRTAELQSTNRELEAFSYSVSHDLRAPLRSVDGFSVALVEDYGDLLQDEGKHYLARIRAGVQRMGQLIDSLLQLSRITRAELAAEDVDLSALAENVANDIQTGFADRSITFSIEPGLHTQADPKLLRVALENMFGNAAKFTGKVEEARIDFGWSPERGAYYLRDNGAGFDQQYAGKLFVAFQRLHGDRDFQGSGIGLATVARVIARHHGTIWAEAEVGKGATFWFTLS